MNHNLAALVDLLAEFVVEDIFHAMEQQEAQPEIPDHPNEEAA